MNKNKIKNLQDSIKMLEQKIFELSKKQNSKIEELLKFFSKDLEMIYPDIQVKIDFDEEDFLFLVPKEFYNKKILEKFMEFKKELYKCNVHNVLFLSD